MKIVNIFKAIITSTIGIVTMLLTLVLVATSTIDFVWGGIAGLILGCVMLLSPDTIIKKFGDLLNKIVGKGV